MNRGRVSERCISPTGASVCERLLLIEDDLEIAEPVISELSKQGYVVTHAVDGAAGLSEATRQTHDVLVVDRALPGLDGLTVIRTLRNSGILTPALILSSFGEVGDKVLGLGAGADDYLAKPFALVELSARIAALLRRGAMIRQTVLRVGSLELDLIARVARKGTEVIPLLPREFDLLEFLMRHAGTVVTRTMLLEKVWHYNGAAETNVVDVYVGKLRRKIEAGESERVIRSLKGVGFLFVAEA